MAALTGNTTRTVRNTVGKTVHTYTVKTSAVIYQHALVNIDVSVNLAMAAADNTTTRFAGMAVTSSTGSFPVTGDGTKTVTVANNLEVSFSTLLTTVTKAFILNDVYARTDNDIALSSTAGAECGTLTEWTSANNGWVFIGRKCLIAGT